ncbi:MAG: 5-bromo-4-chloroindolyl phosphate hydrolysis family protein [Eubacteriales bacterium]|nr:5-bromo-4-chloroindolyl phosphate hydrolysis family protein [Eubacteriales bacterium]
MAKKYRQDKSKKKGLISAAATAAAVALIYGDIFAPASLFGYLIMAGVTLASGFFAYTVGSGLDTTQQAPKSQAAVKKTGNPQVDMIIEKGNELLLDIRRENERIPDPTLSRQIDELESVTGKIFRILEEQPHKAPKLRRFLEYYLPTTLNMLKNYRRIESQKLNSRYAKETLVKIENAMDIVLNAFKKQLDTLYRDDILDLSADMQVFETVLKQDNLMDENQSFNASLFTEDNIQLDFTQETEDNIATNSKGFTSSASSGGFAQAVQKKED